MRRSIFIFPLLLVIMSSSCVIVHDYGPRGRDGNAFFGIDYHFAPPYSYWDNNPDIPYNPILGEFYYTEAGTYDFEYFVNPMDYWYGSYTIYREYGTAGGPYNEPGIDGLDTYLMLFCDPNGWHEDRFEYKDGVQVERSKDGIKIKLEEAGRSFVIEMYKTDMVKRPSTRAAKWNQSLDLVR